MCICGALRERNVFASHLQLIDKVDLDGQSGSILSITLKENSGIVPFVILPLKGLFVVFSH